MSNTSNNQDIVKLYGAEEGCLSYLRSQGVLTCRPIQTSETAAYKKSCKTMQNERERERERERGQKQRVKQNVSPS